MSFAVMERLAIASSRYWPSRFQAKIQPQSRIDRFEVGGGNHPVQRSDALLVDRANLIDERVGLFAEPAPTRAQRGIECADTGGARDRYDADQGEALVVGHIRITDDNARSVRRYRVSSRQCGRETSHPDRQHSTHRRPHCLRRAQCFDCFLGAHGLNVVRISSRHGVAVEERHRIVTR